MVVKRIVVNIQADQIEDAHQFYSELFGLKVVMDQGWIVTFASDEKAPVQLSVAREGGSGTPVPDMSVEVDDVDQLYNRAKSLGYDIVYEPTREPWGVYRFFIRDPFGKLVNVLSDSD